MSLAEFHRDPETMAKCLVQYIACDRRVRREIRAHFLSNLPLRRIAEIRMADQRERELMRRGPVAKNMDQTAWDWTGARYAAEMDRASILFVNAIRQEMADSARVKKHRGLRDRVLAEMAA